MTRRLFSLVVVLSIPITGFIYAAGAPDLSNNRQAPEWAADAVWYQIFPERFRNGDPKNDPPRSSLETPIQAGKDWRISNWTAEWYSRDDWEKALGPDFYRNGVFERRYGGDLQGVLDKLDYLSGLGVNALYFNPLFYARSLHKYDGNSYHHIDPYFGPDPAGDLALIARETSDPATWQWTAADRLFLKVVKEAHARGMKVILDGVFNHTGRDFFAFKNLYEKQQDSPYKGWYVVNSFDDPETLRNEFDYAGWWGHKSLPILHPRRTGTTSRRDRRNTSSTPRAAGWTPRATATRPTASTAGGSTWPTNARRNSGRNGTRTSAGSTRRRTPPPKRGRTRTR